jgi:hypothetical protein
VLVGWLCTQPSPHSSFDEEVAVLNAAFGSLQPDGQGQVYVLGEQDHGLQWHVYVAGRTGAPEPTFNLEMCMTELSEDACQAFFRNDKFVSSHQTTMDTGIVNLLPGADIDDYVFEPCGYSMVRRTCLHACVCEHRGQQQPHLACDQLVKDWH